MLIARNTNTMCSLLDGDSGFRPSVFLICSTRETQSLRRCLGRGVGKHCRRRMVYHATKEDRDGTVAERLKELGFGECGEKRELR